MSHLFDTSIVIDYLLGERRASELLNQAKHRAISVLSWVEVMSVAPAATEEETRLFLRSFERLAINESIADEAARLARKNGGLPYHRALTWATARVNRLVYVTVDAQGMKRGEEGVLMPYRWSSRNRAARSSA